MAHFSGDHGFSQKIRGVKLFSKKKKYSTTWSQSGGLSHQTPLNLCIICKMCCLFNLASLKFFVIFCIECFFPQVPQPQTTTTTTTKAAATTSVSFFLFFPGRTHTHSSSQQGLTLRVLHCKDSCS